MPATQTTSGRASALPPDERRAAIVASTIPLLIERGELVTTRQIAEAAGVSEGTLFRVFDDKDALLAAALDTAMDMAPLEAAVAQIDPTLDFEAQLLIVVDLLQQRVATVWQLVASMGSDRRDGVQRPVVDSDATVELLTAHADRLARTPLDAARYLRAITLSLSHPLLSPTRSTPTEIVDLFLNGVTAGSGETR